MSGDESSESRIWRVRENLLLEQQRRRRAMLIKDSARRSAELEICKAMISGYEFQLAELLGKSTEDLTLEDKIQRIKSG